MRRTNSRSKTTAQLGFLVAGLAAAAPSAKAQTVTVDEGTFQVSVAGSEVGTEAFSIVRRGDGEERRTLSHGQIRLDLPDGTRTMAPLLALEGEAMELSQYEMKAAGTSTLEVRLERLKPRPRLHATVVTAEGEREQEFLYRPGAIVLEEDVAHHYYFLGERVRGGATSLLVVLPSSRDHADASVRSDGPASVQIAGSNVDATKYTVTVAGDVRSLWLDSEGRVLRVERPSRSYVAVRRELP